MEIEGKSGEHLGIHEEPVRFRDKDALLNNTVHKPGDVRLDETAHSHTQHNRVHILGILTKYLKQNVLARDHYSFIEAHDTVYGTD